MEFTFTPLRIGILVALLGAFALFGGFDFPDQAYYRMTRAWGISVLFFSLGAVCVTIVDHWVGNLDRSNLRWLYILLGALCMGGGLTNQHVLKERMKITGEAGS